MIPANMFLSLLSCKTFSVAQDTSLSVTWTSGEPFVFVSTDTVSSSGLSAAAPSSVAESLTPSASFSDGQGRSTTPSGTGSDPQTLSASFSNGNGQSMTSSDAGSSPQSIAGTAPTIVQGSSPSSTSRLNTAIGAGNAAQPGASSGSPIGGGGGDQPDSDGTNPDIGGTGAGVTQVAFAGHAIAMAVVFVSGLVVI
ncbi:hypothetical protein BD324DRAFT_56125 [Kockovaella imperatae]|uniref:Alpha-amylase domain-containing protein n=1 Tax=Kockovaella imperatae TaxID=4999 RepID=A0A1Y1UTF8_9TREE|nr:hypothetical protein BD324DRAFT_56125 [Kockovaella imperatae]ORX41301.1 hypothetical protein BD324DRAFT_56125 [Kockovaella imperatae]